MNLSYLFKTIIGSHMWSMERIDSDIDYFTVFAYPTKVFLQGYHPQQSFFKHGDVSDEHSHEIEKVVEQLLKGNINFILGVISPIVINTSIYHKQLKDIVLTHPPKNIYNSIRGLAMHNYKVYVKENRDLSERRMNKILRVLQFGITVLDTGKFEFKPYYGGTPEQVIKKIEELDIVFENSDCEEKIPEHLLRNFLYKIRSDLVDIEEKEKKIVEQKDKMLDIIVDMIEQCCLEVQDGKPVLYSQAISTYARVIRYLADIGVVQIDREYGRSVTAHFTKKWDEKRSVIKNDRDK